MLLLFDVDATLITTSETGIRAMGLAGRELYGDHFDERVVEYSGRLDPLIIIDLLTRHGDTGETHAVERFRARYRHHLERLLAEQPVAKPCAGVMELLTVLEAAEGLTLGLLTGNYPETGAIKLLAAGIDPGRFAIHVWGCDSPHTPPAREHLPAIGLSRYLELHGRPVAAELVTIIGDTPHDVSCAKAHGCRCLGVATGRFSVDELRCAGADHAVANLGDVQAIVAWLLDVQTAPK